MNVQRPHCASRAQRDAEFRRMIDDAKARHNISDVAAKRVKLKRANKGEMVGLCLFHRERTPSMRLNDAKGTYHCFGCGASGDIVRLVMETEGLGFIEALRWLGAADLPEVDPLARVRAAEENARERQLAIERARSVWASATPPEGTPAEVYARSRGIAGPLPASVRFAMTPAWYDDESGECGPDLPALVGAVTDDADNITGLQRIFLADGGRCKAKMRKPKRSLGRVRGGAMRLGPVADEIVLTEGPEDGLSIAQEMPGRSVWVALGTAMMPELLLPSSVSSLVIAGQNDAPGRAAVQAAAVALAERGLAVRTVYPDPAFKDWNDQLRGVRL
jgi:DNA primase